MRAFLAKDYDDALVFALLMLERLSGYTSCGILLHARTLGGQYIGSTEHWLGEEFNVEQAQQLIRDDVELIHAELQRQAQQHTRMIFGISKDGGVVL
jgi:hypothetical protein